MRKSIKRVKFGLILDQYWTNFGQFRATSGPIQCQFRANFCLIFIQFWPNFVRPRYNFFSIVRNLCYNFETILGHLHTKNIFGVLSFGISSIYPVCDTILHLLIVCWLVMLMWSHKTMHGNEIRVLYCRLGQLLASIWPCNIAWSVQQNNRISVCCHQLWTTLDQKMGQIFAGGFAKLVSF